MKLILFEREFNILHLFLIGILYIITISTTICSTISKEDIKEIFAYVSKEGFENIPTKIKERKHINFKNQANMLVENFSQNSYIKENTTHQLNSKNVKSKSSPEPYMEDTLHTNIV